MAKIGFFLLLNLLSFQSFGKSLFDTKINNDRIYDLFIEAGVPEQALQQTFTFLDSHAGETVKVSAKQREKNRTFMREREVTIKDDNLAIIDFSQPSSAKRLFILNLKTGTVSKHLVTHGKGSGVKNPTKFSNINGSKMSSLGLFVAGDTYYGAHGESMNLYGLESSNNKAAERDIVMHGAKYASEDFLNSWGRLGRSWGCPAVAPSLISGLINNLKEGRVLYTFHKGDLAYGEEEEDVDLPGEEETLRRR